MTTTPSTHGAGGIAAVRGAISVERDEPAAIREATARLLVALATANHLPPERIVSALFTSTPDLVSDFPAHAARLLGWRDVPLLGATEVAVPGAPPRIVRVLVTVRGLAEGERLTPVYLDEAIRLRPDLVDTAATAATPAHAAAPARRVAIVGLGQIGGSVGLALGRAPGWFRIGVDADPAVARAARTLGAVDGSADTIATACADADLAVIATPVDTLPAAIDEAALALRPGAALVDTGSARAPVTPALERAARRGIAAVGGHPIAGGEGHGIAAARADRFAGAVFTLCPVAGREVPAIVLDLIAALGAHAKTVEPEAHDHALARTSHLPYLISRALAELGAPFAAEGLAGPGFRSMTRLAASDPRMSLAYCAANATEVRSAWVELRERIGREIGTLGPG